MIIEIICWNAMKKYPRKHNSHYSYCLGCSGFREQPLFSFEDINPQMRTYRRFNMTISIWPKCVKLFYSKQDNGIPSYLSQTAAIRPFRSSVDIHRGTLSWWRFHTLHCCCSDPQRQFGNRARSGGNPLVPEKTLGGDSVRSRKGINWRRIKRSCSKWNYINA